MIALYCTIFPSEVDVFLREVGEYNKEVERQQQERYEELKRYIKSLKKEDLKRELYNALLDNLLQIQRKLVKGGMMPSAFKTNRVHR